MSTRDIILTLIEDRPQAGLHRFVISVSDVGVEIRREGAPIATRDSSVAVTVEEPDWTTLVLAVEEAP